MLFLSFNWKKNWLRALQQLNTGIIHKLKQKKVNHELKVFINLPFKSLHHMFLFSWSSQFIPSNEASMFLPQICKDMKKIIVVSSEFLVHTCMSFYNPLSESTTKHTILFTFCGIHDPIPRDLEEDPWTSSFLWLKWNAQRKQ